MNEWNTSLLYVDPTYNNSNKFVIRKQKCKKLCAETHGIIIIIIIIIIFIILFATRKREQKTAIIIIIIIISFIIIIIIMNSYIST